MYTTGGTFPEMNSYSSRSDLQTENLMSCPHGMHLQTLTLKDSSKYGTFINSQQMAENAAVSLTAGDNITFGVYNSKFKYVIRNKTRASVEYLRIVCYCNGCLPFVLVKFAFTNRLHTKI